MKSGALKPLIRYTAVLTLGGLFLTGCAHVKPEELDARLGDLRTELQGEMEQGDQELAGEMSALEGRVDDMESRLSAVERELNELAQEFDATVERLESAVRFDMPVYFGFDDAELSQSHVQILDRFAGVIREYYPEALITAEGFTDAVGTPEYNQSLGLRRAQAVRSYLVQAGGLAANQVRTVSYGEDESRRVTAAHGPGSNGWENRRVALVIDHAGG